MSKKILQRSLKTLPYAILIFFMTAQLNTWEILRNKVIFLGDGAWNQARVQVLSFPNFLGSTDNLAFPIGENVWNNPQLGIGNSLLIYILSIFDRLNSGQVLILVMLIGGILNLVSMFLLSNSLKLNFYFRFIFVAIGSLTPFYFEKFEHLGISQYYLVVIFLFVLVEYYKDKYSKKSLFLILLLTSLFSSIWWIIVLIYLSFSLLLINLILYINKKQIEIKNLIIFYISTFTVLLISLSPSALLLFLSRNTIGESRFGPWQSEIFSGKFSDLLTGSNIIKLLNPNFMDRIKPALSNESQVLGLSLTIFFIFLIYKILVHPISANNPKESAQGSILQAGIMSLLFYLTGGFGNLQSTFFNLINTDPPARAWSRLSILLAIIGLYLAFKSLSEKRMSKINYALVTVLVFISFVESFLSQKPKYLFIAETQEFSAVEFIFQNLKDCPVLQLPVDTLPIPQDFQNQNADKFYYHGYRPYLINPEFNWSFGAWTHSPGWYFSAVVPAEVTYDWIQNQSEIDYCAILFDKDFSAWRAQDAPEWPGIRIGDLKPQFENERYQVYLFS